MTTEQTKQAAHEMYVQACGAGQASARPQDIHQLAGLMTRRTVTGMSEAKLNSPQYQALRADKNNEFICSVGRYYAFAHCLPAAAVPVAPAASAAPAASPAQVMSEAGPRETIIRELYNPMMAYSVGDIMDGQVITHIAMQGTDEDNDDFYPTQICTVRPATDADVAAHAQAQAELQTLRNANDERDARQDRIYDGYEF